MDKPISTQRKKSTDREEMKKQYKMFLKMGMVKMAIDLDLLKYPMVDFEVFTKKEKRK